jgi:Replication stress response SDE2 C-terminal
LFDGSDRVLCQPHVLPGPRLIPVKAPPARRSGAERLKEALTALGLKAGGTLQQRAERLFMTKGKSLEQLDRKLFAKGVVPAVSLSCAQLQGLRGRRPQVWPQFWGLQAWGESSREW